LNWFGPAMAELLRHHVIFAEEFLTGLCSNVNFALTVISVSSEKETSIRQKVSKNDEGKEKMQTTRRNWYKTDGIN
jgi:hypothetical protein